MKVGDREPDFEVYLTESVNGATVPIILTGKTVQFVMFNALTKIVKVNSPATVEDENQGLVSYSWGSTDTDTAGDYKILLKVTDTLSGKKRTFPEEDYLDFKIEKSYP